MRIRVAVVGLAIGSLALVGCGGSSDTAESTSSPVAPTEAPVSPSPVQTPTDAAPVTDESIVGVAASNPDFTTLVAAIQAAGLDKKLSGPGPFTVFAPDNEAFEDLPPELLNALLQPDNAKVLKQILKYHVVAAEVMSADIAPGSVPTLLKGQSLTITIDPDGDVMINSDAEVDTADIEATNGVIHEIDEVLIPANIDVNALLQ